MIEKANALGLTFTPGHSQSIDGVSFWVSFLAAPSRSQVATFSTSAVRKLHFGSSNSKVEACAGASERLCVCVCAGARACVRACVSGRVLSDPSGWAHLVHTCAHHALPRSIERSCHGNLQLGAEKAYT